MHSSSPRWRTVRLREIATPVKRGLSGAPTEVLMISSTRGFVRQSEMYSRFMAGESLKKYVELREGEFAYNKGNSKTYPQGCIFRLQGFDRAAVPHVYFCFSVDQTQVCPDFLAQYFRAGALNAQLRPLIKTGVRNNGLLNIRESDFHGVELVLPTLPEQRKIAAILSSVDKTIEKTEANVDQLEVVRKGFLAELLTRGLPGRHRELRDTEIGLLPERWRTARLPEVLRYQNGKAFPSSGYRASGVALVRPGNLAKDGVVVWDADHTTFLDEENALANPEFMVREGEILMNLTAQSLEDGFLGRVCTTPSGTRCLLNQRIARIVPLDGLLPRFAFWVLAGPQFRSHVDRMPNGSKVKHIYNRNLDEAVLPVPPMNEQEAIASVLDATLSRIVASRATLDSLKEVKKALLDALLSGRVRVDVSRQEAA